MKILFVAPRFHTNMHAYVKGLKEMGHEVFFLAMYKSNSEFYDDLEPEIIKPSLLNFILQKINVKYKKDIHRWPCLSDLAVKMSKIKPDILLVKNLQGGLAFFSFLFGRFQAKKTFALVQTEKHAVTSGSKKAIAWFFRQVLKVRGIITPLANVLPQIDPWFSYLPFVIEVKDFEKEYFKDGRINILEIGKFQERKNHLLMLEAVKELSASYPLFLTIAGERQDQAVLDKVKTYIRENGLEKSVVVRENIPYNETLAMYRDSDLFVLPSYNEPAAYSPVEAMANKLPVIASDTCGTACYIERGRNGYVFKSHSASDLAAKIEAVIKDRDGLRLMGAESFKIAKQNHSLEYFKEVIGEIFKK